MSLGARGRQVASPAPGFPCGRPRTCKPATCADAGRTCPVRVSAARLLQDASRAVTCANRAPFGAGRAERGGICRASANVQRAPQPYMRVKGRGFEPSPVEGLCLRLAARAWRTETPKLSAGLVHEGATSSLDTPSNGAASPAPSSLCAACASRARPLPRQRLSLGLAPCLVQRLAQLRAQVRRAVAAPVQTAPSGAAVRGRFAAQRAAPTAAAQALTVGLLGSGGCLA
jgi:hypothetical protein